MTVQDETHWIDRAGERTSRAADSLDAAEGELANVQDVMAEGALERAAVAQAHALVAIAGYVGAIAELALVALRAER